MPASKKAPANLRKKPVTGAQRASITIPPAKVMRLLRRDRLSKRSSMSAGVYLAATMDYIAHEIFDMALDQMKLAKKRRITPRHLMLGIDADNELSKLLAGAIFAQAGKPVHLLPELEKKKKGGKNQESKDIDPSQEV